MGVFEFCRKNGAVLSIFGVAVLVTGIMWGGLGGTVNSVDAEFHIHRYLSMAGGVMNPWGYGGVGTVSTSFYGPLQALIVVILHGVLPFLGWGVVINIFLFACVFCAGFFMRKFVLYVSKNRVAGMVAAVSYMVTPYLYYELVLMQDHPAVMAFALVPLILWGIYRILNREGGVILFAGSFAALIATHLISAFLVGLACLVILLLNWRKIRVWAVGRKLLGAGGLAMGLAAGFILPFLELFMVGIYRIFDSSFVMVPYRTAEGMNDFRFNYLWPMEGGNVKLGLLFMGIVGVLVMIYVLGVRKRIAVSEKWRGVLVDMVVIVAVGAVMMSCLVDWRWMPGAFYNLQFPYRFLLVVGAGVSVLLGYAGAKWVRRGRWGRILMWCVIVGYGVVMVVGYPAFVAKAIVHKAVTEAALEKSVPEYLPVGVDEIPREIVCGEGCGGWRKVGSGGTFEVSGGWGGVAELPLAYYPGYVAVVEESGEGLEVRVSQNGGVMVVVPDGVNGKVRVSFGYTAMRAVGYVVSIGCLGGSIWYLVRVGRVRVVIRR